MCFQVESPAARSRRDARSWDALLPDRWYARRGHRWLDRALLVLVLPPALPVLAAISLVNLAVFGDPRRILFLQPRVGWRGEVFLIWKFRTMKEPRGTALESWSSGGDQLRVTRFGRFLRNTHLDELPQLVNILRGEMSFIGPRPEMVEVESWAAREVEGFSGRLALRPGVAGLAQVTQGYTGRDAAAYARKLEINRRYMDRISLRLDLEIVLRTAIWMLRGKGWDWQPAAAPAPTVSIAEESAAPPALERRAG
jgi:lipopolysaccharide/colanic/teichoic acid biosynthesis glycosyltransferase